MHKSDFNNVQREVKVEGINLKVVCCDVRVSLLLWCC